MSHRAIRWDLMDTERKTLTYKSQLYGKILKELVSPCPIEGMNEISYLYIATQYEEQIETAWEHIKHKFEWSNN